MSTAPHRFTNDSFYTYCDQLAKRDPDLRAIISQYGYPPLWTRPNTFQTLVLTILEQQVSLASAYAAFKKLKQKTGYVTPSKILALTDPELRSSYFSRQKIIYVRELALAVSEKRIRLKKMVHQTDDEIRSSLKAIKGIGDWTVDVYLMHALQRTDLFPLGDIALVNSLKKVKGLHPHISREEMISIAEPWRPFRTIAAMILWHDYIKKRGMTVQS
ncbi:MAG: DNA-3-methyladenine glycosylase 2 family protein [Terrimonas sp.]|nr:DNA-3-methyladenine glycosylase 2 family protein [Terrimonas sp.]